MQEEASQIEMRMEMEIRMKIHDEDPHAARRTYLLVLIETRPLLRNFLPFLYHSTQGCGEPVTLHFKRSLVFACTR